MSAPHSFAFNKRLIGKLAEYREDFQRNELGVWKKIALEISDDPEMNQKECRWQDLSKYFKQSLVFQLLKFTNEQELVDRLQYPYLRKVYVIIIKFIDHYPAKLINRKDNINDNKLFIKYMVNGNYDSNVVSVFKRRGKKGTRVYVNINVEDPVYELSRDEKNLLLQLEQSRHNKQEQKKELRKKRVAEPGTWVQTGCQTSQPAPEMQCSPIILDGVPVQILNTTISQREFSARDLLDKESFSVNTQEYDEIIKDSLEKEPPFLPVRSSQPRQAKASNNKEDACNNSTCNCEGDVIWIDENEVISSTSIVSQDPLQLSVRSSNVSLRWSDEPFVTLNQANHPITIDSSCTVGVCDGTSSTSEPLFPPSSGESARTGEITATICDREELFYSYRNPVVTCAPPTLAIEERLLSTTSLQGQHHTESVAREPKSETHSTLLENPSVEIITISDEDVSLPPLKRISLESRTNFLPDDFFSDDENSEKNGEHETSQSPSIQKRSSLDGRTKFLPDDFFSDDEEPDPPEETVVPSIVSNITQTKNPPLERNSTSTHQPMPPNKSPSYLQSENQSQNRNCLEDKEDFLPDDFFSDDDESEDSGNHETSQSPLIKKRSSLDCGTSCLPEDSFNDDKEHDRTGETVVTSIAAKIAEANNQLPDRIAISPVQSTESNSVFQCELSAVDSTSLSDNDMSHLAPVGNSQIGQQDFLPDDFFSDYEESVEDESLHMSSVKQSCSLDGETALRSDDFLNDAEEPELLLLSSAEPIMANDTSSSMYHPSVKLAAGRKEFLKPVIEKHLKIYAELRQNWPELFSRVWNFSNILGLCSALATALFRDLKPTGVTRGRMLIEMVHAIASRIAYGATADDIPTADKTAYESADMQQDVYELSCLDLAEDRGNRKRKR